MASDDEYEILSHDRVEHLRNEVDRLRTDTTNINKHESELITSMNRLTAHIAKLINIFENVEKDLTEEKAKSKDKDAKIERLLNQNAMIIKDYEDYQKNYSQQSQDNYNQYDQEYAPPQTPPRPNQRPPQGNFR